MVKPEQHPADPACSVCGQPVPWWRRGSSFCCDECVRQHLIQQDLYHATGCGVAALSMVIGVWWAIVRWLAGVA